MIGTLIGIIIALVILGVLWWAIQSILGVIPIAEPFATIVRVLMILVAVIIALWIVLQLLGIAGVHVPAVRLSHA